MFSPHEMGRNISPHFIDLFFSEKCLVEVATQSGEARHPLGKSMKWGEMFLPISLGETLNEMGRVIKRSFMRRNRTPFGIGVFLRCENQLWRTRSPKRDVLIF